MSKRIKYKSTGYIGTVSDKVAEILVKRVSAEIVKGDDKQPDLTESKPEKTGGRK